MFTITVDTHAPMFSPLYTIFHTNFYCFLSLAHLSRIIFVWIRGVSRLMWMAHNTRIM